MYVRRCIFFLASTSPEDFNERKRRRGNTCSGVLLGDLLGYLPQLLPGQLILDRKFTGFLSKNEAEVYLSNMEYSELHVYQSLAVH